MSADTHIWKLVTAKFMANPEYAEATKGIMENTDPLSRQPYMRQLANITLTTLVETHKEFVKDKLPQSAKVLEEYVKTATHEQTLSHGAMWFRMADKKIAMKTKTYFWEFGVKK